MPRRRSSSGALVRICTGSLLRPSSVASTKRTCPKGYHRPSVIVALRLNSLLLIRFLRPSHRRFHCRHFNAFSCRTDSFECIKSVEGLYFFTPPYPLSPRKKTPPSPLATKWKPSRKSGASCCVTAAKPLQLLTAQDITAVIHRHRIHIPRLLSITHICGMGPFTAPCRDSGGSLKSGAGDMGVIVPQYSDASGIYDASNQIEWRAAVSFAFYLPKEPGSQHPASCSDKFFAFCNPQPLSPTQTPRPTHRGIKNCAKLSAFCTFSSLIISGWCSLTQGAKKKLGGWGVFEKWDGGMRKSAGTAMKKSRDWGLKNGSLGASNDNNERAWKMLVEWMAKMAKAKRSAHLRRNK